MEPKIKEQLKELSFQMMLNETEKLMVENDLSFSQRTGNKASLNSDPKSAARHLLNADKKGYELSLVFNELLLKNGKTFNPFVDGPDAAKISAENLLYKYGLSYPISWYVEYEDSDGLHFGYHKSETIERNHQEFMNKVAKMHLNELVEPRIIAAAEYYRKMRLLLTKYHNLEQIEVEEKNTHTK